MTSGADRRTDQTMMVAAEVLLALVTIAAMLSFGRLFSDGSWLFPLVGAALLAHITVALLRRTGRGLAVSGVVSLVVMVLQITWTHYASTTTAGIPARATRAALDTDITEAWNLFSEVKAPTESTVGFLVMATVGIWVIAYLADWAAFRLWSALETLLPSFGLFVFVAFFGAQNNQFRYAALYFAALVAFQLFHRLIRQSQETRWLAGTQRSGMASLARAGGVVAGLALIGAVVAGPALPGAEREPLIDINQRSSAPDTRVVISPIVDIRGRLVNQADVEVFTVRSDRPSYWRLASLDSFNGQIWGADNKYSRAAGDLPDDFGVNADVEVTTQEFTITNLGAVWLPAAYEARSIVSASTDSISYEPTSGTLIVGRDLESSDELTYTLESAIPTFLPEALAAAPNAYPPEILDRYLGLPDDFSPVATELAFEITRGAENDYEKALALQTFFREFDYSLDVGPGHSSNRIDAFLEARIGYCEQFAGSFAAMARALNIPSRVAVGFTWGEEDPNDPGLYRVRGEHAHAWPEIYIPGSGWVAFEPTPTRGAPDSASWTGIEAQQAGSGGVPEAVPTLQPAPAAANDREEFQDEAPLAIGATSANDEGIIPGWYATVGLVLVGAAAAFALYALAISSTKRRQARLRLANAPDNRARVGAIWSDAVAGLRPIGLHQSSSETIQEFSNRANKRTRAGHDLVKLGAIAVDASYSRDAPADPVVHAAEAHRNAIKGAVGSLTTRSQRWSDVLDPRPLFRR